MKKRTAAFLTLFLLLGGLAGCAGERTEAGEETIPQNDEAMFTQRDREDAYDEDRAVTVLLEGDSATASSDSVQISGSTVILKEEATYLLSGSLEGMVVVDAPDTASVQLVLQGADITSQTSAALYVLEADKVFVTLAEGTVNTLANGGAFEAIDDTNIDGALFSRQDLCLNGAGALSVTSPAGQGIVCKDDLAITGGSYEIRAAAHGVDANDSVRIENAALTIDAGKDAIHCENSEDGEKGFIYISGGVIQAEAEGDGISASGYMQLTDGTLRLVTGGGSENGSKTRSDSYGGFMGGGPGGRPGQMGPGMFQTAEEEEAESVSMKGLKAAGELTIAGGDITINAADDAIHSDASMVISGGSFTLASGDDAFHAEDTLTVSAGDITITESYEGLEALHLQILGGSITLTADDDGLNAAGGTDSSGITGGRDGMFGGPGGAWGSDNGSITISGGQLCIHASGDGLDANGTLEITGGYIQVESPAQGDTATLDYDTGATITGGVFIGTGASGMAQTFSDSSQGVVAVSMDMQKGGTTLTLKDNGGNILFSHTPEEAFALVILSSPELVKGQTYTLTAGSLSGQVTAY